ncbi:AraC family transcriptional regulator [Paenibacillus sp. GD4]|uniref:helix-turn-helix transcriptional regulator n=1 Tax=Paenibacillus sp. GD4 TaxID=3068890 RepID=UPI0027967314|nr:AraC family transcriptional regulator [Paenibacillus sp. GD4]MDQ1909178.1 AraC family transcriptional regulator [Paenibacillus sp. GD4]
MKRQRFLPTIAEQPFFILPESVGWYWDDPEHTVDRRENSWNTFSIHYIVSGKGYLETVQETYLLERGDAFLYFPLQRQRYYSDQEDPWSVLWIHFYGTAINEFLIERGFHRSHLWTLRQTKPLEQAFEELLTELEKEEFYHLSRMSTLTYAILAEFVNQAVPQSAVKLPESTDRILQLLPRMQNEACKPFDLPYWAQQAEVSTFYFCKLFKKATQMTPMEFITLCRLQKAKQWLLEKKEWTIREIAMEAGYPSISYFNKRFLEQESMTPSEYRQLYWKQ